MQQLVPVLTENATKVLGARYLIKDAQGQIVETPQGLFGRVAQAIAEVEALPLRQMYAEKFYNMMAARDFLPNTPCLVNAGRPGGTGQLSACFVIPVPDSMDGIFEAVKQMALVHKTGGGTGFSFSRLRPSGDFVKSTTGIASGPISFMQVFDAATEHIKQGGVRRGANMGILRVDHPDVMHFIRLKLDRSKMQNFNISVGITDEFMSALAGKTKYALRHPTTRAIVEMLDAQEVWNEIVRCAWTIGDPGLWFLDRTNKADPLVDALGEIEATNPCGEVPLRAHDACTLGSINLSNFYTEKFGHPSVDFEKLEATVHTATRFLDNVLSVNKYPVPEIGDVTAASRKIGLGVMGWADLLVRLGIPYASQEARDLGEQVMHYVNSQAIIMSECLADDRGPFGAWDKSAWKRDGHQARRNATVTVIAPTGSISIIAGCSSGIEPLFALSMTRNQAGMTMLEVHPLVEEVARREGFWSDELGTLVKETGSLALASGVPDKWRHVFRVANEIPVADHIKMQAAFQRHTEDGVSKTINMRAETTPAEVEQAYMLSWAEGCKGITIYRDGCRGEQVLTAGASKPAATVVTVVPPAEGWPTDKVTVEVKMSELERRRIPKDGRRTGATISKATPYGTAHVTINNHPDDNEPFECFVRIGKSGTEVMAWTEAFGRAISYLMSIPSPITPRQRLDAIARQLAGIGGGDSVGFGEERVVSAPDAIGHVILDFLYGGDKPTAVPSADQAVRRDMCPSCGQATLTRETKCGLCSNCGFSKC